MRLVLRLFVLVLLVVVVPVVLVMPRSGSLRRGCRVIMRGCVDAR
jgi:hypothetical protein